MRHYSTSTMVEHLTGLLGTDDLNKFETGFVEGLQRRLAEGTLTALTDRQITVLDHLFSKHFA